LLKTSLINIAVISYRWKAPIWRWLYLLV